MGGAAVLYTVRSSDQSRLLAGLSELGYEPQPRGEDGADVRVPVAETDELIGRLTALGVKVTAATPHGDDLEAAYLRLVGGSGRPS